MADAAETSNSVEAMLHRLEEIAEKLEDANLDLAATLDRFEAMSSRERLEPPHAVPLAQILGQPSCPAVAELLGWKI